MQKKNVIKTFLRRPGVRKRLSRRTLHRLWDVLEKTRRTGNNHFCVIGFAVITNCKAAEAN